MTLKQFIKDCHRIAVSKGFWGRKECIFCGGTGKPICFRTSMFEFKPRKKPISYAKDRKVCVICKGKAVELGTCEYNLPEKLMLIVSELGEACEALRKNIRQKGKKWTKDTFEDEISDVWIRLADLCGKLEKEYGINWEWQIKKKMTYNKKRKYKHGKSF